jgi:hypothetical protein
MNATTLTKTARSAFSIAGAALSAIAILTIAPKSVREREIAAAKRSIAERKAQIAVRAAAIEAELEQMKAELATTLEPERMPELPNPWESENEPAAIAPAPEPQAQRWQLCLPAAKPAPTTTLKTTTQTATPTIRELKKLASARKIRGYGSMTKAELIKALNEN